VDGYSSLSFLLSSSSFAAMARLPQKPVSNEFVLVVGRRAIAAKTFPET
jgi:hypothetical protein